MFSSPTTPVSPVHSVDEACTWGGGGGPGKEAAHQTAVEQQLLGDAVVPAEMLQVLPPLGPLSRGRHGLSLTAGGHSQQGIVGFCLV